MSAQSPTRPLLREVAEGLTSLPYETWNFGDSVAFEGLLAASRALGDERYLGFVHGWIRSWASMGRGFRRLDCTAPGSAMVEVYHQTGDTRVLEIALRLADYLVSRPRLDSGLFAAWERSPLRHPYGGEPLDVPGVVAITHPPAGAFIDCLHFDPPFLTSLGSAAGRSDLLRTGVEQALTYVRSLQQFDGLFNHFELAGREGTFGQGWGRGQGWALLGLLDVVHNVPEGFPGRDQLLAAIDALVGGMAALQREDGHWPIDVRKPASGDEYSTAAFMAVGLRRVRRAGESTLDDGLLKETQAQARRAVLAVLDGRGRLPVSAAVMACTTNSHYAHVPTGFIVPWGQGPVALMLAEEPS